MARHPVISSAANHPGKGVVRGRLAGTRRRVFQARVQMGRTDLYLCKGPQARKVCLRAFERTRERDARADEEVLQMTLGNDQSGLSQCECPEMRVVPPVYHSQRPSRPCA